MINESSEQPLPAQRPGALTAPSALTDEAEQTAAAGSLRLTLPVNARKVALTLALIAVCLGIISITSRHIEQAVGEDTGDPFVLDVLYLLNVNREANIPTWFSASLLLACSALIGVIALAKRAQHDRFARHWTVLGIIFLYMSVDEAATIHEKLTVFFEETLHPTGVLYFGWVIVGAPLVVIFALSYLRFWLNLPPRTRALFAIAGMVYIGGALLIESISANQWYQDDGVTLLYSTMGAIEEVCEMLGVILLIYALLAYIERFEFGVNLQPGKAQPMNVTASLTGIITRVEPRRLSRAAAFPALIVFSGGMNLILVQWVLVREMTTLLLGTELVVLLVSVAYFAGLSVGYLLAGRIRRTWLPALGVVTLALHLTLPIWFRLLVAGLGSIGAYWAAYLALPLLTPFVVSAFYSVFLPLFVDDGAGELPKLYALEVLGSAAGVLVLVALGSLGMQTVLVVYSIGLLLILWALRLNRLVIAALAVLSAAWLAVLPDVNYWSNSLWYEKLLGFADGTTTLFSGYSPYQKVDVLETPGGSRYLMLDGLEHFGGADGHWINIILGKIPAALTHPENALVVGAGAMQTEQMIAQFGGQVTTVEIDPMVVDVSLRYFTPYNQMDVLTNHFTVVDDAKHFIASTGEIYDLVATDTPAAFGIQTATLYSLPFYRAVHRHLAADGVLAANLTSSFAPDDLVSRRIVAGLLESFDDVMVVTSGSVGWSFAYASDNLPFDRAAIENALQENGEIHYAIFDTPAVRAFVGDAEPITLDSMDIVLQVSADYIGERLQWR